MIAHPDVERGRLDIERTRIPKLRGQNEGNAEIALIASLNHAESGFVLIGAVWLLMLCAAIGAALMLRASNHSNAAADHGKLLAEKLLLDAATETVAADILFNGPRSRWWVMPAEGDLTLDGQDVRVRVSNEARMLDINTADLALIQGELQTSGVPPAARARLVAALGGMRLTKRRINARAELFKLLSDAGVDPCVVAQKFTLASGLTAPRLNGIAGGTSNAGGGDAATSQAPMSSGDPIRLEIASSTGSLLVASLRITGDPIDPIKLQQRETQRCENR